MECQVTTQETETTVVVRSPFSHGNNEIFRSRSGYYDRNRKGWVFRRCAGSMAIISHLFGLDSGELVQVAIPAGKIQKTGPEWRIGGYVLAQLSEKSGFVRMPPGVELLAGRWNKSGGAVPSISGSGIELACVVRRTFADENGLVAVPGVAPARSRGSLADFSNEELLAECERRGIVEAACL